MVVWGKAATGSTTQARQEALPVAGLVVTAPQVSVVVVAAPTTPATAAKAAKAHTGPAVVAVARPQTATRPALAAKAATAMFQSRHSRRQQ